MKIAMLIDGRHPVFGGGQLHVKYLSELLVHNHNCKVDLFVRKLIDNEGKRYDEDEIHHNYRIYRTGPTGKFFNIPIRILSLITTTLFLGYKTRKEKYDIIHAHAYVSGLPAKIIGTIFKIPVVYTVHGTMGIDANKKGILASIERRLILGIKYNLEISVSHKIFDYKNVNKNIVVLHNGVDLEKYNEVKITKKKKGMQFIRVGRFDWQKGLEYLIEGINLIDRKKLETKGFKLNLIGDGELLPKIKGLVQKYKLSDFVNFKGKMFSTDLVTEYKENHVFILPSLAEGQPLTLLEAMASKLPAIVTDVGDNKYFVKDDVNGYIIKSGNNIAIKKSIEKMLDISDKELGEMVENNYELAKKYDRKNVAQNTYDKYLSVIK